MSLNWIPKLILTESIASMDWHVVQIIIWESENNQKLTL